ncbi:hypothetical protein C8J56DRAFT_1029317 [Mycena floridula]|nr:hypothetical protein C8J56DRAFT_1029317 [Mycena floridula]
MGYTHYWRLGDATRWAEAWPQVVEDAKLIIANADFKAYGYEEEREDPIVILEMISFNGYDKDGHDEFTLLPVLRPFQCCKTARKAYDEVVTAVLLRASMIAGNAIRIISDGEWEEWEGAQDLCKKIWPNETIECPWSDDLI